MKRYKKFKGKQIPGYKQKIKYPKLYIIDFIANWVEKHNNPPTLEEIAKGVGLRAKSGISQHLHEMGIDYSKEKYKLMYNCPYCKKPLREELEKNTEADKMFQEKREEEIKRKAPSELIEIPIKGTIKDKQILWC